MYEDFYEGPSYFDEQIDEFKESLRKEVKKEILNEIEKLKKENQELQDVKNNFNQIKLDYEQKKEEFNKKESDMMRELARKKVEELTTIADLKPEVYWIDSKLCYPPKCNKCDENRQIHFLSPSGKDCTEACPVCGNCDYKYFVKPMNTLMIRFKNDPFIKKDMYYRRSDSWGESVVYEPANIYKGTVEDFNYDHYNIRHTAFESKELAQQICDETNKRNNVPDNLVVIQEKE